MTETELTTFLDAILGDTEGHLCVAVGLKPFRDEHGKYKHHTWSEVTFEWPRQADEARAYIDRAADKGDTYLCPYVMCEPRRRKGLAGVRRIVHADIDHDLDEKVVEELGGFIVRSGSAGHGHVYVPVTWAVTPAQHEVLCRALSAKLGGDHKYSDNDLLRPPGTWNYKTAVDGGERSPVTAVWCSQGAVDPRVLADELDVDITNPATLSSTPRRAKGDAIEAPVNVERFPAVAAELDVRTDDRSADTYRIAAACRRAKLTLDETRFVVHSREDLRARLDGRPDDDLAAVWLKLETAERTAERLVPPSDPAVDGAAVLDKVAAWFRRFIAFTADADADLLTLWCAHTHLAKELRVSPRLQLDSITYGSGKTTVLEHLKALCVNGVLTVGGTAAVIPRLVHMRLTTVLFDEIDRTLAPGKEGVGDLIAIINSGHRYGSSRTVLVPTKDGWEAEEMSTFAPVALSGNSPQLPDDTVSRTLRILLMPDEEGLAEDTDWPLIEGEAKQLHAELMSWAESVRHDISISGVTIPGARGRQLERWRAIKAVADAAGGHWPEIADRLIAHGIAEAQAIKDAGITRVPPRMQLLLDLFHTWKGRPDFISTAELCDRLVAENRAYWGETATRTALTPQRLGKMIADATKQLSALEKSQRPEHGGPRGYHRDQFVPTWRRLGLPLEPVHPVQSVQSDGNREPTEPGEPTEPSTR